MHGITTSQRGRIALAVQITSVTLIICAAAIVTRTSASMAATTPPVGKTFTTGRVNSDLEIAPRDSSTTTTVASLSLPAGRYLVTAQANFQNGASFVGQDNSRIALCGIQNPGSPPFDENLWSQWVAAGSPATLTFQRVLRLTSQATVRLACREGRGGTDRSFLVAQAAQVTAVFVK